MACSTLMSVMEWSRPRAVSRTRQERRLYIQSLAFCCITATDGHQQALLAGVGSCHSLENRKPLLGLLQSRIGWRKFGGLYFQSLFH